MVTTPKYISSDDVEASFYMAFSHCESTMMQNVWSKNTSICVHPGSSIILGYEAVMRSWAHIFANAVSPAMRINVISRVVTGDMAIHVVEEHISTGHDATAVVLATNVYQNSTDGWKMIEHHASLINSAEEPEHRLQ